MNKDKHCLFCYVIDKCKKVCKYERCICFLCFQTLLGNNYLDSSVIDTLNQTQPFIYHDDIDKCELCDFSGHLFLNLTCCNTHETLIGNIIEDF